MSAIITTHNRAALLPEALDSVYAQEGAGTQFELDVIVVDDASTDSTPEVVRCYPRVKYIRFPANRGVSAARNAGIRASRSTYVAFLDDDDLWLPCKLRRQVPALEGRPDAGVVYSQNIVRSGKTEVLWPDPGEAPSGSVFRALLMDHFFGPGVHSFLVRRAAFSRVGYFDESLHSAEDYDMWLRLAFQFPFIFIPGAVAIYRTSPHGKFGTLLAHGCAEQPVRRVYAKALGMLPDSRAIAEMKDRARAHMELRIALQMSASGRLGEARALTIAVLRAFPGVVDDHSARVFFSQLANRFLASDSPIGHVWGLPDEFKAALSTHAPRFLGRTRLHWVLSDLWAGIATGLSFGPKADHRLAGRAALLAVLHEPSKIRRKNLLWYMARAVVGHRWVDALVALRPQRNGRPAASRRVPAIVLARIRGHVQPLAAQAHLRPREAFPMPRPIPKIRA